MHRRAAPNQNQNTRKMYKLHDTARLQLHIDVIQQRGNSQQFGRVRKERPEQPS